MTETPLLPLVQKYFERDLAEAADSLEMMGEDEALKVLNALPAHLAAEVFPHLQPHYAAAVLRGLTPDAVKQIAEKIDPQQCATIFKALPQEIRHQMIESLSDEFKAQIRELLLYPEDSAGAIMTPSFIAFRPNLAVKDAIHRIRLLAGRRDSSFYAYVADHDNKLVGVMNMRDLMLAPDGALLEHIMRRDVFSVNAFMDREQVAEELSNRGYFAAPVVDGEGKLLGVVKGEHLIQDVQEEATEDIQKMFGAGGDERVFSPIRFSLAKRLPWLHVNLLTAFLAAAVISIFEDVIAKFTILAVFLPVVAGQGGNAGAQSLAVVMRGLVMREIPRSKGVSLALKETMLGAISGIVIGLVTAGVAWLWQGNPYFGVVIGLAMLVNLTLAGLSGAAIPMMMKAVGLDPAQCSNIILTTITDVMGFFSFLGFAVLFQNRLM